MPTVSFFLVCCPGPNERLSENFGSFLLLLIFFCECTYVARQRLVTGDQRWSVDPLCHCALSPLRLEGDDDDNKPPDPETRQQGRRPFCWRFGRQSVSAVASLYHRHEDRYRPIQLKAGLSSVFITRSRLDSADWSDGDEAPSLLFEETAVAATHLVGRHTFFRTLTSRRKKVPACVVAAAATASIRITSLPRFSLANLLFLILSLFLSTAHAPPRVVPFSYPLCSIKHISLYRRVVSLVASLDFLVT